MSVKRRDFIKYLEENNFISYEKEAITQYTQIILRQSQLKDIGFLTESLQTNYANKPVLNQSFRVSPLPVS